MNTVANIRRVLYEHKTLAVFRGSYVWVMEAGTMRTPDGVVPYNKWVRLPLNLKAIYNWLGY